MFWIIEFLIALIITIFFVKREKPKLRFLFYGYFFVLISLILQIPTKYLQLRFSEYFQGNFLSFFILSIITLCIVEIMRYFSLKRFLKTKSYKNGILFGIGWSTITSINYFKLVFFSTIFSFFSISFDYTVFLGKNLLLFDFVFYFIFEIALTVLMVLAIIKKKWLYIAYACFLHIFSFLIIYYLNIEYLYRISFQIILFLYSLYIIFHYRKMDF